MIGSIKGKGKESHFVAGQSVIPVGSDQLFISASLWIEGFTKQQYGVQVRLFVEALAHCAQEAEQRDQVCGRVRRHSGPSFECSRRQQPGAMMRFLFGDLRNIRKCLLQDTHTHTHTSPVCRQKRLGR